MPLKKSLVLFTMILAICEAIANLLGLITGVSPLVCTFCIAPLLAWFNWDICFLSPRYEEGTIAKWPYLISHAILGVLVVCAYGAFLLQANAIYAYLSGGFTGVIALGLIIAFLVVIVAYWAWPLLARHHHHYRGGYSSIIIEQKEGGEPIIKFIP